MDRKENIDPASVGGQVGRNLAAAHMKAVGLAPDTGQEGALAVAEVDLHANQNKRPAV